MPSIKELHPAFQPYAARIAAVLGPRYTMTSARRSQKAQAALYDAYLAGTHPLTVAPPGCSKHQLGVAADFARAGVDPLEDAFLASVGRAWRSLGGEWGGEKDPVHFALPGKLCP